MSMSSQRVSNQTPNLDAAHRALAHLFREFELARNERDASESRMARFVDTIEIFLQTLPDNERREYKRRFDQIRSGVSSHNRGGEVFGNVIALFKQDRRAEWTIPEVQTSLEGRGTAPDTKALYNAIAYLAKTGRLRRVSRGRYLVTDFGTGVETDLEGRGTEDGTSRATEHEI